MLIRKVLNNRINLVVFFMFLMLLVQCTIASQVNPSTEITKQPEANTAIDIATLSQMTETPIITIVSSVTPGFSTFSATSTPIPTPQPSEMVTPTPSLSQTPTPVRVNENILASSTNIPIVVALAHVDLETDTFLDKYSLYLMNLNGGVIEQLVESDTEYFGPSLSPDCEYIAFVGESYYSDGVYHNRLFLMEIGKNNSILEIATPFRAHRSPNWSPDGKSIIFEGVGNESAQIHVYTIGSQELTQLTIEGNNHQPNWSPDGMHIVFTSDRDSDHTSSIYVMNTDGSEQKQLLPYFWGNDPSSFENPAMYDPQEPTWSPDGKWIAFSVTEYANDRRAKKIYVMTNDGLDARPIVPGDRKNDNFLSEDFYYFFEGNPKWLPDGTQILFLRSNGFTNETSLCIASVSGEQMVCNPIDNSNLIESFDWCVGTNE